MQLSCSFPPASMFNKTSKYEAEVDDSVHGVFNFKFIGGK
jgi:hypothetical protein